jgi:hypothetical protein
MAAIVLTADFQTTLRDWKFLVGLGANPMRGIYENEVINAGSQLAAQFAPGTEIACMGDRACWVATYYARYGGVTITAVIESGNGKKELFAEMGCQKIQQNPSALDSLRKRRVRAVVGNFEGTRPCSSEWLPLGKSSNFYYRPL